MPSEKSVDFHTLIEQAAYLLDEIEALRPIISRLSDDVLTAQLPPTGRSVKEYYGAIVEMTMRLASSEPGAQSSDDEPDPDVSSMALAVDWNARPIDVILDELRQSRRTLLDELAAQDEAVGKRVLQQAIRIDLQAQRLVSERLFDVQPPASSDRPDKL